MSRLKITGEQPFQVLAHSFAVSSSEDGYTLEYSANGVDYTEWDEATPANETLVVNGIAKMMYFRLKGNTSEVDITY